MRAPYVNGPGHLTPIGEWIAARLPHWAIQRDPWPYPSFIFRIFGLQPYWRFALVDYTSARMYLDKPAWVRLRVFQVTLFERNRRYSGLPGARACRRQDQGASPWTP